MQRLLPLLKAGQQVAYISDAGTPGISDPGARLVQQARQAGFMVRTVPGPSALTALMALSGYEGSFAFLGFLERKPGALIKQTKALLDQNLAVVFFESPHRIQKSMAVLAAAFPDAQIFLAREITKAYEEHFDGKLTEVLEKLGRKDHWKGEFCGLLWL